jgi:hypothetical protein
VTTGTRFPPSNPPLQRPLNGYIVGQTNESIMGINVRAETEQGEAIVEWDDPHGRTKNLLPSYSDSSSYCLRFVDRIGDAVFNQAQIPFLVSELRRQLEGIIDPAIKRHGENVLRVVEHAQGRTHVYVRFLGD